MLPMIPAAPTQPGTVLPDTDQPGTDQPAAAGPRIAQLAPIQSAAVHTHGPEAMVQAALPGVASGDMPKIAPGVAPEGHGHDTAGDRTVLGIVLMVAFCVTAPLIDVSSKLATATIPVGQITLARFLVQAALMVPVCLALGHGLRRPPGLLRPLIWRAVFLILSTYTFVGAVRFMPLADALAIAFVEPFVILLIARFWLREPVGPRRLAAVAVGFAGALLVIQPSFARFGLVALLPLGTAVTFALYMLSTRGLSRRMDPVPMQLHTAIVAAAICLPVLLVADGFAVPTLTIVAPQGLAWAWLAGVGAASAVAHLFMSYALKFAPSQVLAPIHYSEIVMAVTFGWLVFGDLPNALSFTGIAIIVASGLYVFHRERLTARRMRLSAE